MSTVYLGLGTNLGDRLQNLADARDRLRAAGIAILRESPIYETAPRDLIDQPLFLNQVIEVQTESLPRQLLTRIKEIERDLGRQRTIAKGPRVIDIDILLFGKSIVMTPELEIPHPRMTERRFVLEPLASLAPNLLHPEKKLPIRELLAAVNDQDVRIYSGDR